MAEVFREIQDYTNYEVSNIGNVKNKKTGRIIKKHITHGYYRVGLCKDSKETKYVVHRLVASAFINNPLNKDCVDHTNNNKLDNRFENLRWATSTENNRNTTIRKTNTTGVKGVNYIEKTNTWRARICIDGISIHIGTYDTLEEAKQARIDKVRLAFGDFANTQECNA